MVIPRVNHLRREEWAKLSQQERIAALQELEDKLAQKEGRTAYKVSVLPQGTFEGCRGQFDAGDQKAQIQVNPLRLRNSDPYGAVETYFHEARHGYQHYAALHPGFHPDAQQEEDFKVAEEGGYIPPEQDYTLYRFQPTENDACDIARQRTEQVYMQQFGDFSEAYNAYRKARLMEIEQDIDEARLRFGDDYVEEARKASYAQAGRDISRDEQSGKAKTDGEEEGYGYGYGL